MTVITILSLIGFTGCKAGVKLQSDMQNVEQRDYATILLVASGNSEKAYEVSLGIAEEKKVGEKSQTEKLSTFYVNDFEELAKEYQAVKGKSLSLVHLKAILLAGEQQIGWDEQWYMLSQMGENEEIAKTCPVLQISDKDEFLEYVKDAKEPVGTYIHDLIKINEEKGKNIPQVKDYLKVMREGTDLQIYNLEKVEEGWQLICRDEIGI